MEINKKAIPFKDLGMHDIGMAWDGPKEIAAADVTVLKQICAWMDEENPDVKSSYKMPHHTAGDKKAVWKGVVTAMAALLGARGGVDIPADDKQGVYDHLASHYKQFSKDAPAMKAYKSEELATLFPDDFLVMKREIAILKRDDEKQIVYGIVYEPDTVDAHGDYTDAEEIERVCHDFLEEYQNISFMHQELINKDVRIAECYIAPVDFPMGQRQVKKGSWVMATHILNSQLWGLVKEGKITGYSMEGTASR
ncbi:MAG: XkdF-like putative serine protease domain-containing protein [Planctomycetota bacterium]